MASNYFIKLKCKHCNLFYPPVEDKFFIRKDREVYHLHAQCKKCNKAISKKLSNIEIATLPRAIRDSNEDYFKSSELIMDEKSGGFLPLAVLLPLVFGGIAAASKVADTVANTVIQNKKVNAEIEHNKELENIARGSGISESDEQKMVEYFIGKDYVFI